MQLLLVRARTDHQDHAWPVAGAHEDVLRAGGTVEEVPWPKQPLHTLDEQPAFPRQHEEGPLLRLGVVERVRLARPQHLTWMPSCEKQASPLSNRHPEPNVSDVHHSASRTFTTNQPAPAGARPEPASSSRASGTPRLYRSMADAVAARASVDSGRSDLS